MLATLSRSCGVLTILIRGVVLYSDTQLPNLSARHPLQCLLGGPLEDLCVSVFFFVYRLVVMLRAVTGPKRSAQSRRVMTILIVVMFVLSTIHNAAFWAYVRRAFIAHGETSQSTADALNEYPDWFTGVTSVSDANAILADCIIVRDF